MDDQWTKISQMENGSGHLFFLGHMSVLEDWLLYHSVE
jgi:hypothetical protein